MQERIRYKIIILSLKDIYGLASTYLCSLITIQRPSMYSLRRSDYLYLKPFNAKASKTLGDRSFTVMAPSLFNTLPRDIRHENNFTHFKSLNKTLRSVHFGVVVVELIKCKCGGIVKNEIW